MTIGELEALLDMLTKVSGPDEADDTMLLS